MKCARCGADVPSGNQFCGICGQPMLQTETPLSVVAQASDRCSKCGAALSPGDRFCGTCGELVPASRGADQSASSVPPLDAFAAPRRQRPNWVWLLLGAGVTCFLCVATIIGVNASPNLRSTVFAFLDRTATRPQVPTEEATAPLRVTASVAPTALASPTATRSSTLTPSPTLAEPGLQAAFAGDVTIPDNTVLEEGQAFSKTWRVRNSGDQPWPVGVRLVYVTGDELGDYASPPLNTQVSSCEEV
mgnify:CR=1 FL=1